MSEQQYQTLRDRPRESLGIMAGQVWQDDPRRLGIILARYKFVAKMLSGRASVAEVGCGDAFGSRTVKQEVAALTVYDFDPMFLNDIMGRRSEAWPVRALYGDIMAGPLSRAPHDAIYSLDVIEHVSPERQHEFMGNIAASLAPHGVVIVGTPSLESQPYASSLSVAGHVGCMSGEGLRRLAREHFHTVFMFGMSDEVVHTGFLPMCHYLFCVCAEAK
jgi:2-polyprenyl-3-methyl-5-hydroxy-6-metoxy-1,4-benzoquinol methylase